MIIQLRPFTDFRQAEDYLMVVQHTLEAINSEYYGILYYENGQFIVGVKKHE